MQSISCCCNNPDCLQKQEFDEIYKRISLDATLAAEIGQLLLQEKSNGNTSYDVFKDTFNEKRQLQYEKEKSDTLLFSLQQEMSKLKSHSDKLQVKLDAYEKDIRLGEQLLLLKTNNEQALQDQVADLKQELSVSHKSQGQLANKHKRLVTKHETLQLSHEILKKEYDSLLLKSKSEPTTTVIPNTVQRSTHPYDTLYTITKATFDKINATDTRILNRKLRRVFDMTELSDMSNTILRDILSDLEDDFRQLDDHQSDPYFLPLSDCIQRLLIDVSQMRLTMNDLQADYVKRIENTAMPAVRRAPAVKEEPIKLEYYIDAKEKPVKRRGFFDLFFLDF
ncbi:hypothetical protein K501DRAFT_327941 [Backusella circina FSU 941]|nr:hypothetical protein K501DRAFT_327941 [Backusella circina FSU 941]